jgi:glutaminyl-peptide cyclotransferase
LKQAVLSLAFAAALLCTPTGCSRQESEPQKTHAGTEPAHQIDPNLFNNDFALANVSDFIAIGQRHSGSQGAALAAQYLAAQLQELDIEPIVDEFENDTPEGVVLFRNVMGVLDGLGDKVIVIGSHYDTKKGIDKNFAGANDSGSSTGLLLELARVLTQTPAMETDIVLVFFDGEECVNNYTDKDGLHGSRHLARTLVQNQRSGNVVAVIIADMIGDSDLNVTIPRNCSPDLTSLVFSAARDEGYRLNFSLYRENIIDDHLPFVALGMPAIDLIDFEFGSRPGENDYWHTSDDTIDKLDAESLGVVGRVIIRTINKLNDRISRSDQSPDVAPGSKKGISVFRTGR